ncbi:hypothetical protein GCM10023205_79470 [Yinghuangia aomiensis]|uniref:Uncharacterized protein n=1 Tax=Yinghuangia aomiensis TaxID=676205 RepID=A0ABP9ICI7_9ACTN
MAGGPAGARLAAYLAVRASCDVILREVRALSDPSSSQVRGLGLIDVEARMPIDLLPDGTAGTVAAWLAERRGIKVVVRDRCSTFSRAATPVLPDATPGRGQLAPAPPTAPRCRAHRAHIHRACLREGTDIVDLVELLTPMDLAALIASEPEDPPDSQIIAQVR